MHATYIPRTKWSFYENPEAVEQLILSLNERGLRESALKNTLLHEKERIVEGIQKCAVHRLDNTKPEVVKVDGEVRKSTRQTRKEKEYDANLFFPPGTPVEEIMQRTLVDMILETEEKIAIGGLGSLKVFSSKNFNSFVTIIHSSVSASRLRIDWSGEARWKTAHLMRRWKPSLGEESWRRGRESSSPKATQPMLTKTIAAPRSVRRLTVEKTALEPPPLRRMSLPWRALFSNWLKVSN